MFWFAAEIQKCPENQIWTARTDCMKASSFGIWPHSPKTILVKDIQPPCHIWLPWCNFRHCRVFRKQWPLFLNPPQYWSQNRIIRNRCLPDCPKACWQVRAARNPYGGWPRGKLRRGSQLRAPYRTDCRPAPKRLPNYPPLSRPAQPFLEHTIEIWSNNS